ncbi:MAG: hypothetical protein KGL39_37040 [Patescibacteria group bacterium]|nr:hypothetical protein [Patescibacteria group bacterium]
MSNLGNRKLVQGWADGSLWKTALTDLVTDVSAFVTAVSALIADDASIRTNFNLARTDVSNARTTANALVTDATAIRTTANALVTDATAIRATGNALVTDVTAVRTTGNASVTDIASLYTSLNAMVTDWLAHTKNNVTVTGALAAGTTAGTVKTTATCTYLLGNTGVSKSATDNLFNLTALTTAANGFAKVLLQLDASGTATVKKGAESTTSQAAALFPAADANTCVVGWVELGNSYAGGAIASGIFNGTPYAPTVAAPTAQTGSAAAAMTASAAAAMTASAAAAMTASAAGAIGSSAASAATATAVTAVSTFTDTQ